MANRREKVASSASSSAPTPSRATPQRKADIQDLKTQIAKRLTGLSPEERRSKRGQQVFLESVLVWEFGDEITSDPAFAQLTAEIQQAIEKESAVSDRFGDMLESL